MVQTRSMTLKANGITTQPKNYVENPASFFDKLTLLSPQYTFTQVHHFGKKKTMIEMLVDECHKNNGITKKDFLKKINKKTTSHGEFFTAAKKAGIVKLDTKTWKYHLGPHYEAWLEGRLFVKK